MPSQISTADSPNGVACGVRSIPFAFDSRNREASARELILALRPEWSSAGSRLELTQFKDGITNTLLKVVRRRPGQDDDDDDADAVLLRAYGRGTDVLIDRHRETQNHALLMRHGLAPELLATFANGLLYRFIRGTPTQPADLRRRPVYTAVARRLAQWHARVPCIHEPAAAAPSDGCANGAAADYPSSGKPPPNVWTVMQKWIRALPTETKTKRARQESLQKELALLIKELSQRPGLGENGLVFAHCDLLSGNVIIEPTPKGPGTAPDGEANGDESTDGLSSPTATTTTTVSFIDYEYATPSPAAFDLANHFAEWGGFECDHSVLPTRAQRADFIRAYAAEYLRLAGGGSSSKNEDGEDDARGAEAAPAPAPAPAEAPAAVEEAAVEEEARKLEREVDAFRGLPGFYWGIWALIQAEISQIDFDYARYAETRLGEYWAWRGEADGSRAREGRDMPLRERRWAQEE
ncbi:kinase-like protein [Xylariaceae sp. FL0804]|nr:kinase-like protein [Xylariaceae sp. FL0804]